MKTDSKNIDNNNSPAFSAFAYSLLEDILANAANPARMSEQLVGQLRELTGARLVVLTRHRESEGGLQISGVDPDRRRPLAESPSMMALASQACDLDGPTLWESGMPDPGADARLDESLSGPSVAVPLRVAREGVGALLLFGLPHDHSLDQVIDVLDMLSDVVALVLRSASLFEDQEAAIAFRTRELVESEERLNITLRSIGDAVIATDIHGSISFLNPVAEELTGWTEDEARGRPLEEVFSIIDEESRQEVENPVTRVMREGGIVGLANHTLLIGRDGRERPIADSGAPIRDTGGEISGVVLVFHDQTRERAAQKALQKSERFLNAVFESIQDGLSVLNPDLTVRHVNGVMKEWYADNVPLEGKLCHVCYHDSDQPCDPCPTLRCIKTRKTERNIVPGPVGSHVEWLELFSYPMADPETGEVTGIVEFVRDISNQKRVEEALHESEQTFRQFFENEPAYCYMVSPEGAILDVNRTALDALGFEKEELLGEPLKAIYAPESQAKMGKNLETWGRTGRLRDVEMVIQRKDGELRDVLLSADAVRDEDGAIIKSVSVQRDITERKKAEAETRRLETHLLQQQKLESIGNLAGGVAHDLNNLLAPILGYGEMLLEDTNKNDPRRTPAEEIVSAGLRARDLVRQLLAFSRKQTLEYKLVDLNEIVTGLEKLLRRTIREDIEIKIIPSPDMPAIMADLGQIEQVILNLAVNSAAAMPSGGHITIETSAAELDEYTAAEHEDMEPGKYVQLVVRDTGCGMDEKTLTQAFEPFFSTKGEQGTGLGLSTVYGIVKQHGGQIQADSEPDKGTTVKIYLPVAQDLSVKKEEPGENTVGGLKGFETILLVEDNEMVRNLTNTVLRRQGYTVLVAENGAEALTVLASCDDPVHLILTDVVMPEMSGKELFVRAAEMDPSLRVLYMSGYAADVIASRGVLDEGIAFIQKPFTVQALAVKIREVLEEE